MIYHYIPIRMMKMKKRNSDVEEVSHSYTADENVKGDSHSGNECGSF